MSAGHRFSVFCRGDAEFVRQQIRVGLQSNPRLASLWLAASAVTEQAIIAQSQANQYLGQQTDVLVFDASEVCRPDALAAALGTLRGGGLFFMLLPANTDNFWLQRFISLAEDFARDGKHAIFWQSTQPWPKISWPPPQPQTDFALTDDQQTALPAILKVALGHRRRPLLITADRGRGKSTLLGLAAANLVSQGKTQILLTAPSKAAANGVLASFQRQLAAQNSQSDAVTGALRFVAPDELLDTLPAADLLLVDEAAALPQAMLKKLLKCYPRIVFASTLHGYEGSGLGFKYQFSKLLDQQAPGWQQISLSAPVRWTAEDPLEQFSYQALLMAAELPDITQIPSTVETPQFMQIMAADLAKDELLLTEVFALLVNAHYRTRPSDLQALLDDKNRTVWLLQEQQRLVGVCWLNQEGPLDVELAEAVHQGKRRLKSDLLPQTLLTHAGDLQAAELTYQRIIRIAVRPDYQRQGLGSDLLTKLLPQLPKASDVLGCSFALQLDLFRFWQNNGFVPVRLGLHEDTVSAGRAVVMLRACTDQGHRQILALQQRLAEQWPLLLPRYFADLPAEAVFAISCSLPLTAPELSAGDQADIDSFVTGQRVLEFSFVPLLKLVWQQLPKAAFTHCDQAQQALLIQVFLQQQPLNDICRQHLLSGHKALLAALREAFGQLLSD
ncbi:MAG: GNAT family N-acetyltransferase [Methylophaga sp.]